MDDGYFKTDTSKSLFVYPIDHDGIDESGVPVGFDQIVVFFTDQEFFDYYREVYCHDVLWCGFDEYYRVERVLFLVDGREFPVTDAFGGNVGDLFVDSGLFGYWFVHVNAYRLSGGGCRGNLGRFGRAEFYRGCRSGD